VLTLPLQLRPPLLQPPSISDFVPSRGAPQPIGAATVATTPDQPDPPPPTW
jgi:hypothetical protein